MSLHRGAVAVASMLVLTTAGCSVTDPDDQAASSTESPGATRSAAPSGTAPGAGRHRTRVGTAAQALALLAALRVQPRQTPIGYDRDAFGPAWADVDGNGCNQRDDVLLRDALPGTTTVAQQGSCDHDVLAGTWLDPYTGQRLVETDMKNPAQAQAVQIDHVVPLAEAWASGADRWSDARREQFADDLSELLAVDGPTNESKGDDDPAAWRPRRAFGCAYAERWIAAKTTYDLSADRPEKRALHELLGYC